MDLLLRLKTHMDRTLLKDLEYTVSIVPKTSFQNLKRYIRFQVKRVLPRRAIQLIRSFFWSLSLSFHYFRPLHILKRIIFRIRREHYIALYGGFGDLLMMLPFFKVYADTHKKLRLILVYNDPRCNKFKTTSYWKPLYFETTSGQEIVPIKDFLQNLSYIEKVISGDIWDNGYDCWFAPHVAQRLRGAFFKPSEYRDVMSDLFSEEDMSFAERFFKKYDLQDHFVITLHFRTSVERVGQLYDLISKDDQMGRHIRFLLLGITQHDPQKSQNEDPRIIDLRDNYEKGINIRQLLATARKSHLYLGGRGGFDLFFWLARVPTINIFDLQGKGELEKMWPDSLWKENRFNKLYWGDSFDAKQVFQETIRPYFEDWLNGYQREANRGIMTA